MADPIAVVCTARPSYAKLQPVIQALVDRGERPDLYLTSGALPYRFGAVVDQARRDFPGCRVVPVYAEYDGYTLTTAAKSTGSLLSSLADAFAWHRPRIVVVNHDRREVLAAAQAAAYQNIPVAHIGGGERSGNIDDRVRDAISCLADRHYTATQRAALRVETLTKSPSIVAAGCPTIDLARRAADAPPVTLEEIGGAGAWIDLSRPFLLVLQHSETEDPDAAFDQMQTTLLATVRSGLPTLVVWPGADAGADGAAKAIRLHEDSLHAVRAVPPARFLRLMKQAAVLVGNSSAGIREASYLGTSVVNIGDRQRGRERCTNTWDVPHVLDSIAEAIRRQAKIHYPASTLYGDGYAAERIATDLLAA